MIPLEVYSSSYVKSKSTNKKVIVLDLDETIGSFRELYILWTIDKTQKRFNDLLDLYPEFLRYGILNIVDYLKHKKKSGNCFRTYIYTNNILSKQWVKMIIDYIEHKQSAIGLFDKIIHGYNKSIDCLRTTKNKTHSDFIRCSVLPRSTEICYIDDTYFNKMECPTVYYIQPKPYHHSMKTSDIVDRYSNSNFVQSENRNDVRASLYHIFIENTTGKSDPDVDVDILVSQKIMYHIREFFMRSVRKHKTRKIQYNSAGRFTRKKL